MRDEIEEGEIPEENTVVSWFECLIHHLRRAPGHFKINSIGLNIKGSLKPNFPTSTRTNISQFTEPLVLTLIQTSLNIYKANICKVKHIPLATISRTQMQEIPILKMWIWNWIHNKQFLMHSEHSWCLKWIDKQIREPKWNNTLLGQQSREESGALEERQQNHTSFPWAVVIQILPISRLRIQTCLQKILYHVHKLSDLLILL